MSVSTDVYYTMYLIMLFQIVYENVSYAIFVLLFTKSDDSFVEGIYGHT